CAHCATTAPSRALVTEGYDTCCPPVSTMILGRDHVRQPSCEMADTSGQRSFGDWFHATTTSPEPRSRHSAAGALCPTSTLGTGADQLAPAFRLRLSQRWSVPVRSSA